MSRFSEKNDEIVRRLKEAGFPIESLLIHFAGAMMLRELYTDITSLPDKEAAEEFKKVDQELDNAVVQATKDVAVVCEERKRLIEVEAEGEGKIVLKPSKTIH